MKKIISLLIVFSLLFTLMSAVVYTAGGTAEVVLEFSKNEPVVGDLLTVDVKLKNITTKSFFVAQIALYYDNTVLSLEKGKDGITDGSDVDSGKFTIFPATADPERGLLSYALGISLDSLTEDIQKNGYAVPSGEMSLFSVEFKVIGKGEAKLQVAKRLDTPDYYSFLPEGAIVTIDKERESIVSFPYNPLFIEESGEGRVKGIRSISDIPEIIVERGTSLEEVLDKLPKMVEANLDDGEKVMIPITFSGSMPEYNPDITTKCMFAGTLGEVEGIENYKKISSFVVVVVNDGEEDVTPPVAVTFSDLQSVPWAQDMILSLANAGILNGKAEGLFMPDDNVTRAEFVMMLVKAFDIADEGEGSAADFDDVVPNDWFYKAVAVARRAEISAGYEDNTFKPNNNITRQEMAAMAYRVSKMVNIKLEAAQTAVFSDDDEIAGYARDAIYAMQQGGIISGLGDGNFGPGQNATRAQAAVIICKLWNLFK